MEKKKLQSDNPVKFSSAIIDIAIDRESYKKWCNKTTFLMVNKEDIFNLDTSIIEESISHGGECIRYYESATLNPVSHFILLSRDDKNKGDISELIIALKWCIENNISLIILSMGTTQYCDSDKFRDVLIQIKELGICLIAGASNKRVLSYPACFDECIGVCYDYTRKSVNGSFVYIENPIDGVEIVINPNMTELEAIGSTSMATAYFAGLVAKATSNGETTPKEVMNWIKSSEKFDFNLYDFTFNSIIEEYSEDVVIVSFAGFLCDEKGLDFRRELQRIFLSDEYYCLSVFSEDSLVLSHNMFEHEFTAHEINKSCSYEDYLKLLIKLCEPNIIFVDAESYSKTPDVVISKDANSRVKDEILYLSYNDHTPQEAFERIVRYFDSEGASESEVSNEK